MTNGVRTLIGGLLLAGCSTVSPPPPLLPPESHGQRTPGPAEVRTTEAVERVRRIDPQLGSVIALDPTAIEQARRVDLRFQQHPLAGRPILIKDNIEVAGPLPTTAGSL